MSSTDLFSQKWVRMFWNILLIQWGHTYTFITAGPSELILFIFYFPCWLRISLRTYSYWYYVTDIQNLTNFQQEQNKCIQGTVSKKSRTRRKMLTGEERTLQDESKYYCHNHFLFQFTLTQIIGKCQNQGNVFQLFFPPNFYGHKSCLWMKNIVIQANSFTFFFTAK